MASPILLRKGLRSRDPDSTNPLGRRPAPEPSPPDIRRAQGHGTPGRKQHRGIGRVAGSGAIFLILVPRYGLEGVAWSVVVSWAASLVAVCALVMRVLSRLPNAPDDEEAELRLARHTGPKWQPQCHAHGAIVVLAVLPLGAGIGVAVAPSGWPFLAVAALAIALAIGSLGAALRVKPAVESIGKIAAAGAIVTVAWNAVRLGSSPTLSDAFLLFAALILMPTGLTRRLTVSSIPIWLPVSGILLLVAGVLSAVGSADPEANVFPVVVFVMALALVPLTVGLAARTPRSIRSVAVLYVVSSAISGGVAVADLVSSSGLSTSLNGLTFPGRSAGLSVHPNHLALAAAMALPFAYALTVTSKRRIEQALIVLLFLPIAGGVFASGSRAGLICVVVGVAAYWLFARKSGQQVRMLAGVVAVGVVAVAVSSAIGWGQLTVAIDRLTGIQSVGDSNLLRLQYYGEALDAFASSPLVGAGFSMVRDAHDVYLQLLEAGGLFAILPFLIFSSGAVRMGLRLCRDVRLTEGMQPMAAAATASMLTWLVGGLVQNQIYDRYLYIPCGILVGLSLMAGSQQRTRK